MTDSYKQRLSLVISNGVENMRFSQVGILLLIAFLLVSGTGCNFFARKNLVDGAEAFKNHKFDEAEKLFRLAVQRAPKDSVEGKTAQLFLARTLHSEYAGDRGNTPKAEEAIAEYEKVLAVDPGDNSSFRAIVSLYENLGKEDLWTKMVSERSENTAIPNYQRAEAYTSLASKQNTCANDITEDPAVKKTVTKDGKSVYVFSKPAKPEDLAKLKECVQKGTDLINKALALETDESKTAKNVNIKPMSDKDLNAFSNKIKPFESAKSYKTSLLIQSERLAEMEGRTADKDNFGKQADAARAEFKEISEVTKNIKDEQEGRAKAIEDAKAGAAATNTNQK